MFYLKFPQVILMFILDQEPKEVSCISHVGNIRFRIWCWRLDNQRVLIFKPSYSWGWGFGREAWRKAILCLFKYTIQTSPSRLPSSHPHPHSLFFFSDWLGGREAQVRLILRDIIGYTGENLWNASNHSLQKWCSKVPNSSSLLMQLSLEIESSLCRCSCEDEVTLGEL